MIKVKDIKEWVMANEKGIRYIAAVVGAFLFSLSFSFLLNLGVADTDVHRKMYFGYNIFSVLTVGAAAYFINRFLLLKNKRLKIFGFIIGLLLSTSFVYGAYLHFLNNLFYSLQTTLFQIVLILGINLLLTPLATELLALLDRFSDWSIKKTDCRIYTHKQNIRYFLIMWLVIFIAYVPMFLSWWPGNFIWDAKYQLLGTVRNSHTNHHPLLHTWLMETAYKIGLSWGNASSGFQLYTLLQMLILSSSFAYCLFYFRKKGMPKIFRTIVLLWFAVFPVHGMFAITATKDVLFAAFFLYTVIFACRLFFDKEQFKWYTYVAFISVSVLSALFRNNAIYAIVPFLLIAILFVKKWWNKGIILILTTVIYVLTSLSQSFLMTAMDAREAQPYRESLSVPLQCMARVACYRPNELDDALYEEMCLYISEARIPYYDPYNSDSIKNDANEELLKNNLFNFLKLWVKVGIQFPDEYVESFLTNTFGYWYLFPMYYWADGMRLSLYHTLIGEGEEIIKENYGGRFNDLYFYLFCEGTDKEVPVLGYSSRIAPYTWILLLSMFWFGYKKKWKQSMILLLPLLYFGTCLLGPIVALRYVYAVVVCVPVYFYVIANSKETTSNDSE